MVEDTTAYLGLRLRGPMGWEQHEDSAQFDVDLNMQILDQSILQIARAVTVLGGSVGNGPTLLDAGTF